MSLLNLDSYPHDFFTIMHFYVSLFKTTFVQRIKICITSYTALYNFNFFSNLFHYTCGSPR